MEQLMNLFHVKRLILISIDFIVISIYPGCNNNNQTSDGNQFFFRDYYQRGYPIFIVGSGDGTGNDSKNYDVIVRVTNAYAGASTALVRDSTGNDLEITPDIHNRIDLFRFGVIAAQGNPDKINGNFRTNNISNLVGFDNLADDYPTSDLGPYVIGTTWLRLNDGPTDQIPSLSLIFVGRINILFPMTLNGYRNGYNNAKEIGYCVTHELGHGRGIKGDFQYIDPPHGGRNAESCAMLTGQSDPGGTPIFAQPVFCDTHKVYLAGIRWKPTE
jgi:hypothetical protein